MTAKNIDEQYLLLLEDIILNSNKKSDRTGTGTLSVFGRRISHNMEDGFPLLTTKKMAWKSIVTELLWFLRGDTNIKYLLDNNSHIWDGDCYQRYCMLCEGSNGPYYDKEEFINKIKTNDFFGKKWGDLGKIYGYQWRNWGGIDQIQNLIDELKTNPDSRRLMVSAWNVSDLPKMALPPCHYSFQFYTRELDSGQRGISLMWNQRSVDTCLGLPFNIASYGLLLHIVAKMVGMVPEQLIGSLGDTHIYRNHVEGALEQIKRTWFPLPSLVFSDDLDFSGTIDDFLATATPERFKIENYTSHPSIKFQLSN
jgi:thymidylate synthase